MCTTNRLKLTRDFDFFQLYNCICNLMFCVSNPLVVCATLRFAHAMKLLLLGGNMEKQRLYGVSRSSVELRVLLSIYTPVEAANMLY